MDNANPSMSGEYNTEENINIALKLYLKGDNIQYTRQAELC